MTDTDNTDIIIQSMTNQMQETLEDDSGHHISQLQDQARILSELHTHLANKALSAMRDERHADPQALSLALRAQNQFCRTLLVIDHLISKDKTQNELSNSRIIE